MKQLIYIAEDEKNIRETLQRFLEKDGYEVCAFETGDALLGVFFKKRADLVILDIMMPGTDGLTCCRRIREKDNVPIILLTAKDTEYDYVNGILHGGDDYLSKRSSGEWIWSAEATRWTGTLPSEICVSPVMRSGFSAEKNLLRFLRMS